MKQKIIFIDKTIKNKDGSYKKIEKEISLPNKDHLQSQIKYKHIVFRDKTKYTRKKKHKNKTDE